MAPLPTWAVKLEVVPSAVSFGPSLSPAFFHLEDLETMILRIFFDTFMKEANIGLQTNINETTAHSSDLSSKELGIILATALILPPLFVVLFWLLMKWWLGEFDKKEENTATSASVSAMGNGNGSSTAAVSGSIVAGVTGNYQEGNQE